MNTKHKCAYNTVCSHVTKNTNRLIEAFTVLQYTLIALWGEPDSTRNNTSCLISACVVLV